MMAKRYYVQIAFADNGGIVINGPVTAGSRVDSIGKKMYICKSLDPKEIGEMFLAFHADLKLSGSMPLDLDNIEF
jgi:hypothetical protein